MGTKINDMGWNKIQAELGLLKKKEAAIGVLGKSGSDLVIIAASNEFGTKDGRIPARSFIHSTVKEIGGNGRVLQKFQTTQLNKIYKAETTADEALNKVGVYVEGKIKKTIKDLKDPPNAPYTIHKKGSSNPLIDTGRLRNSIDFELRNK